MLRFNQFILEYLTPSQEKTWSKVKMSPKARSDTDHFFGKGVDHIQEPIKNYDHDKSEVHKKVESHLGRTLTHDEYKAGRTQDHHGREVRLSKLIKDPKIQHEFSQDSSRAGAKALSQPYMTVVRGHHVAGQTNPEPDALHPHGHSWAEESCKNIKDGDNKKYLNHEIKHGSVVVRAHNPDGKEIYRSTLQPHYNDQGHVAYGINGEYGIKHPSFTAHSHDVASRLSGEYKPGVFKIHPDVYNDSGKDILFHPKATPEHIGQALKDKDLDVREAAIRHPNATPEHISQALKDKDDWVRRSAIKHPNATPEHISQALKDEQYDVRESAIRHPKATSENISQAMKDPEPYIRQAAIRHPNATPEHISHALKDEHHVVRRAAIEHPKATPEHINQAMNDLDAGVRESAIRHPKATSENISQALKDKDPIVRRAAIMHPNATPEHIDQVLKDPDAIVRRAAIMHPNATPEHISQALKDKSWKVRRSAIKHPNATPEHISQALKDEDWSVREAAIEHPNATPEHISHALKDKHRYVRQAAKDRLNSV